ncbi:MAG: DUF3159 domain-containing protein [Streptosporangiaceae bacterium]
MSDEAAPTPGQHVTSNQPTSLYAALGGRRGVADTGLPGVVFAVVYTVVGLTPALWAAVGVGAVLLVVRLVRRETLQYAIAGFVGVALAAFVAHETGRPEDFFLPKLLINAGYAVGWAVSIVVRWPLLGVVVGLLMGEGVGWRRDPARMRAFTWASWLWVGMFAVRLLAEVPLYLAGQVVALGVVHLVLSWPLWALVVWLSWLLIRPPRSGSRD